MNANEFCQRFAGAQLSPEEMQALPGYLAGPADQVPAHLAEYVQGLKELEAQAGPAALRAAGVLLQAMDQAQAGDARARRWLRSRHAARKARLAGVDPQRLPRYE